jgi:hypothetical protein
MYNSKIFLGRTHTLRKGMPRKERGGQGRKERGLP